MTQTSGATLAGMPDADLLDRIRAAMEAERVLKLRQKLELDAANEAARLLLEQGWDLVADTQTPITWNDLEDAAGISRSAIRNRVTDGSRPFDKQRTAAYRRAAEARDRANDPGPHDAASIVAAARLLGVPATTFRRTAFTPDADGHTEFELNADGLVVPPAEGWLAYKPKPRQRAKRGTKKPTPPGALTPRQAALKAKNEAATTSAG